VKSSVKKPRGNKPGSNPPEIQRYQWKKGQSGNPLGKGRKPITEALQELSHALIPGDPQGRTYAERAAEALYEKAGEGDIPAIKEAADRVDGKVNNTLSGPDGGAIPVDIEGLGEALEALLKEASDKKDEV
jgi:hypothetical protein